jgi:arsenate reductase (thioredoxin)
MREAGVDITSGTPKLLSKSAVREADVVITMGCGDTCPIYPGKRYEDWDVEDPAGEPLADVRRIREHVRGRVEELVRELSS